ncbi:unnamed protein product [Pneumocystis jirovecii]|uniref:INO80 complex subunit 3 N-terminal domain-containing protein n=2 Tax=Pneumocystis jirovecii TaxID=42068 RepID=L0PI29_PNEJI|nr:uncharacterized protein T551_02092 [Pneumocystis jirovecii RU7]KTW29476.1 hypothetical protein T551_02092 [Pneumocystis jirovecii RU7]CCJ31310.1 unnamed protein product [Pneumocystis jirovecii]
MSKSFKRKYKKLCERFDALIEESEQLQEQIQKAKAISNRISAENTYLLDLILYQKNNSISPSLSADSESGAEFDENNFKNQNDASSDISSYYRDKTPPHLLSLSPHWDYSPPPSPGKENEDDEYENQSILLTNSLLLYEKNKEASETMLN